MPGGVAGGVEDGVVEDGDLTAVSVNRSAADAGGKLVGRASVSVADTGGKPVGRAGSEDVGTATEARLPEKSWLLCLRPAPCLVAGANRLSPPVPPPECVPVDLTILAIAL